MSHLKKSGDGIFPKIARLLDFQADSFGNIPVVELKGSGEAVVYGCSKVLEYSEECVKLRTVKQDVIIIGRDLALFDFTAGSVSISGNICCVRLTDDA